MKKLFLLPQLLFICGALGFAGIGFAQVEEEEEEPLQARPNPAMSQKTEVSKSAAKLSTKKSTSTKTAAKMSGQRPEGAPQLNANGPEGSQQVAPTGVVNE